jgi:hypothetical protein
MPSPARRETPQVKGITLSSPSAAAGQSPQKPSGTPNAVSPTGPPARREIPQVTAPHLNAPFATEPPKQNSSPGAAAPKTDPRSSKGGS